MEILNGKIAETLSVKSTAELKNIVADQLRAYKKDRKHPHKRVVLDSADFDQKENHPPPEKKRYKSLDSVTSRSNLLYRTDDIFSKVKLFAAEEGVEISRILRLLLTRCDTKVAQTYGKLLWEAKSDSSSESNRSSLFVPVETALAVYHDSNLGRKTYSNQRKILSAAGYKIFPPWYALRDEQRQITPPINIFSDPHVGVYFSLFEAMKVTAARIFSSLDEKKFQDVTIVDQKFKFGFDGSGSHSIFNQANSVDTNNMILTMFCPLKWLGNSSNVLWEQQCFMGAAFTQRRVGLQMGKESTESLQSLTVFNKDIEMLRKEGFLLEKHGKKVLVKSEIVSHMLDMKAAHMYLGLGGCYCDLCDLTKIQCLDKERIEAGFQISRNIDELHSIFNEVVQEDGKVVKVKNDYDTRKGVTSKPIPTNDVKSVQVLHALLRSFDHFMKTVAHVKAGVFDWSESPSSYNNQFLKRAKAELQEKIQRKVHGIKWDFPDSTGKGGTTTTGNIARELLYKKCHREIIISEVPERFQSTLRHYGQSLSVIIRILSSKSQVNVDDFKLFCSDLYLFLLDSFPRVSQVHLPGPWISITPALHKVLAHSWELIELNDGFGLGALDESGLEGCNKILRKVRNRISRKTSQEANLSDTLIRMWVGSDPIINIERMKAQSYCKNCKSLGHSTRYCTSVHTISDVQAEDDQLFAKLIIA